jgi:hypothetical protein
LPHQKLNFVKSYLMIHFYCGCRCPLASGRRRHSFQRTFIRVQTLKHFFTNRTIQIASSDCSSTVCRRCGVGSGLLPNLAALRSRKRCFASSTFLLLIRLAPGRMTLFMKTKNSLVQRRDEHNNCIPVSTILSSKRSQWTMM